MARIVTRGNLLSQFPRKADFVQAADLVRREFPCRPQRALASAPAFEELAVDACDATMAVCAVKFREQSEAMVPAILKPVPDKAEGIQLALDFGIKPAVLLEIALAGNPVQLRFPRLLPGHVAMPVARLEVRQFQKMALGKDIAVLRSPAEGEQAPVPVRSQALMFECFALIVRPRGETDDLRRGEERRRWV